MKKSFVAGAAAVSLALGMLAASPVYAESPFAQGRILVKPAAGLSPEKFEKILERSGGRAKAKIAGTNVHIVEVPVQAEAAVANALNKRPEVAFAELDLLVKPMATNDPDYGKQWHLPKMGAESAWQVTDGTGVTVAVLDTGVYASHPDLSGQVLTGWNTVSNNSDTADIHKHGTWVAGVISAKVNNFTGGASTAPGTKILPIRITDRTDGGAYYSDMAEGITWAADNGARVANLSYNNAGGSSTVAAAGDYMMGKGGVVVVAAGNDNTDKGFANHASLFVAAATTSSDAKASYSNYGNYVDIAAPGSGIYTTSRNGGYSTVQGTSFASPNAAAVAALVMSANPSLLPTDVLAVVGNTSVDLGGTGWDPVFGRGRVDAQAAAEMAASVETSDTVAPQTGILDPVANKTVSGLVPVIVEAIDAFGVQRVDFLVDGQLVASETQSLGGYQYEFIWDSTGRNDGQAKLSARAVDAAGNTGFAQDVFVQVVNAADDVAPVTTIISPADGGSGSRSVTLAAQATDNVGVTQISMYAAGKLICSATSSVSCSWNLRKVAAGTYTIRADAKDAAGNVGSSSVSFTVTGGGTTKGGGKPDSGTKTTGKGKK